MKILAVDDAKLIRRIVSQVIELLGYEALEAGDGEEGLQIVEKEYKNIKCILLDWNMPKMNGYELLCALKEDQRFKDIPVIMVTTEVDKRRVIQAIQAGATNYVMKPFSQEDLMAKIMQSLGMGV